MLSCQTQSTRGAKISPCGQFRHVIWRSWGPGSTVLWIGLNPSTADAQADDPTLRRMIFFSKRKHGRLLVCNLFERISPDPRVLTQKDVGEADHYILAAAEDAHRIVVCWGATKFKVRVKEIERLLVRPLYCLGTNKDGSPKHPLYLKAATDFELYREPTECPPECPPYYSWIEDVCSEPARQRGCWEER